MLRILFYITTISLCISLIYASDNLVYSSNAAQQTSYEAAKVAIPNLPVAGKDCNDSTDPAYSGIGVDTASKPGHAGIAITGNTTSACDSPATVASKAPRKSPHYMGISYNSIGCCIHDGCDNSYKVCRKPRG